MGGSLHELVLSLCIALQTKGGSQSKLRPQATPVAAFASDQGVSPEGLLKYNAQQLLENESSRVSSATAGRLAPC